MDWDNTENLYIEGDNLEALKLCRNLISGKVGMICIDPPTIRAMTLYMMMTLPPPKSDDDLAAGNVDGG